MRSDASPAFYETANDPNVLPRPEAEFRLAAERGLFYVVEDDHGDLRAASGVFDLAPGVVTHMEAGGTLVIDPFRGFKLQRLLLQVRIAAVAAYYGDAVEIISAVKPTNLASLGNVRGVGFETWTNPVDAVFEPCATCEQRHGLPEGRRCCCDFNLLPRDKRVEAVRDLLANLPTWRGERGDKSVEVELRGLLFREDGYLDALRDFVC